MHKFKRFNLYSKKYRYFVSYFCPLKILYFKRTKWIMGQSKLARFAFARKRFYKRRRKVRVPYTRLNLTKVDRDAGVSRFYRSFKSFIVKKKTLKKKFRPKFNKRRIRIKAKWNCFKQNRLGGGKYVRRKRRRFFNLMGRGGSLGTFRKMEHVFRNGLNTSNMVNHYFNGGFKNAFFKHTLNVCREDRLGQLSDLFVKPELRLDLMLWRLQFFVSIAAADVALRTGMVVVNGEAVFTKIFLKPGDVVHVRSSIDLHSVINRKIREIRVYPLAEVDYYTNTFVVVGDENLLSSSSLSLIIRNNFNSTVYKNYILNKGY